MGMTNRRNRAIYRLWAPLYDSTIERFFAPARRRAMEVAAPRAGERVLLVGVGTGTDLTLLPAGVTAVGTDLSPAMLARARRKLPLVDRKVTLLEADAQSPLSGHGTFDVVILNLILSVVPDGAACLRASLSALAPGGRAVIFDKFVPDSADAPTLGRRLLNAVTTRLGTDVTRRFGDLARGTGCRVLLDEPSLLGGMYRILLVAHDAPAPSASGPSR